MTSAEALREHAGPLPWYAVYTRHQHENTVAESLSRGGMEVFLPTYSSVRKWKDRTKHLMLPLFPSYVFLHGGLDRRIKVLSTPGVYSIVGFGGHPVAILESEMEAIRKAALSGLLAEPHPFLQCGDRVRVKTGPLAGIAGILVRRKSSYRLILSAELLQKSIAIEVDAFTVEPLSRVGGSTIPFTSTGPVAAVPQEFGERAS
jgi:transcription antitermination factor NusG